MPKSLIFDAFMLLICKKNVAIYALLQCKIFSLKIWLCKFFDKFHVWMLMTLTMLPPTMVVLFVPDAIAATMKLK